MEPIQPSNQTPEPLTAHQSYYVVAADLASLDSHELTIGDYQLVVASAQDDAEACDVARHALEEGLVPVVAFSREDLLAALRTLAGHPLAPGASYNLAHRRTDQEMAKLRAELAAHVAARSAGSGAAQAS